MQRVDFYKLTRPVQERFLGSVRGSGMPVPILELRVGPREPLVWCGMSAGATLLLLILYRIGYGSLTSGLAIHPDYRGRRLADAAARLLQRHLLLELGYHRLQLECYGFNERAIRHAERAGFVREGVRRKAYWRHGRWNDGVLFSLVREDPEQDGGVPPC